MIHPRVVFIGLLTALIVFFNSFDDPSKYDASKRQKRHQVAKQSNEPSSAEKILKQLKVDQEKPAEERDAKFYLKESANLMAALYYQELGIKDLARIYRDTGLEPFLTQQVHNELTVMIRTKKSWPGTKYYEANFAGDSFENLELNNFTFHYQPGEGSFAEVQDSVLEAFEEVGQIVVNDSDARAWELAEGYYLQIRYITETELELGDFMNSYTEEDRGSLVVTVFRPNSPHAHD